MQPQPTGRDAGPVITADVATGPPAAGVRGVVPDWPSPLWLGSVGTDEECDGIDNDCDSVDDDGSGRVVDKINGNDLPQVGGRRSASAMVAPAADREFSTPSAGWIMGC